MYIKGKGISLSHSNSGSACFSVLLSSSLHHRALIQAVSFVQKAAQHINGGILGGFGEN
jgi:hypothetical protein